MNDLDKVNILLVDDQPGKLLAYQAILGPLGENLVVARSGKEALEQLLKHEIAVILIDVCMPDLDGFELAAMIRDHPRHQRAAIIFVSAIHMTDIDRLRGYESGGVDYVSVPVEPQILRARVSVFADLYRKTRQLERLNQQLEERVQERTSELTAAATRLGESEAALKETDRRKDEFLSMLAHELRNPLAAISNTVEILRHQPVGEGELQWGHEVIDRQADHLSRLVDDLLDVSRITRGKLEIRREPTDLVGIVRGAADAIRPFLGRKNLHLNLSLPTEPIPAIADVVRVAQVVFNLLDNACKFTPDGGTIWLTAETGPAGATISVRDSGRGIAAEEIPRLFQMFYQTNHGTVSADGGLGIGLALVHKIVEMHGGSVEVRSEGLGRGSEFLVHLPVADLSRVSVAAPAASAAADPPEPRRSRRILVVDDHEDSAESLSMLLSRSGNEVRTVHDGLTAITVAESFQAEVVLLDIGLPLLDGYHVAAKIREQPWGKTMTLVAVTGWGREEHRRRAKEAGFDAHLIKPVEFSAVSRLLAELTPRKPEPEPIPEVERPGSAESAKV
ncbi:MAG TPA: response regulator [Candidatus Eisenbacteria bacterium]|nr:response regulator [Candidatus Eisenbacteria bacterium]